MTKSAYRARLLPTASAAVLALFCNDAAYAQADAPASADTIEQVIVTGSRLGTGFTTPTPVTAFTAAQIEQSAPDSVMDAVAQLPQLAGSQPTTNSGAVSAGGGVNGEAILNLRNLGGNRTLVLLNGNRLSQSNTSGTVDVNTIPQALISRVDVVTGGASATYGSDAVAGVVNFILNNNFDGFKGSIDGGETQYGDGAHGHASAAYGTSFLSDRLHVIGSADYFEEDGIGLAPQGSRIWYNKPAGAYANLKATNPPTATTTTNLQVPDVRFVNATYGGLITGVKGCASGAAGASCNALVGQQFLAGGTLAPFDKGTNPGTTFTSGGDGPVANNGLSAAQHRFQIFAHATYKLDDNISVWGEASYNSSHSYQIGAYPFENGTKFQFTIQNNNAYLPAAVAAIMAANPNATFTLGRYSSDLIPIINNDLDRTMRFAGGVDGAIDSRWTYDASLNYTRTAQYFDQTDTINRNLYAAADAVKVGSNIVCRSTTLGLDTGCVPIDLFGVGSIAATTPNAIPYVERYDQGDSVFHQINFDANLRGDLGDRWKFDADPISLALGVTYRRYDVNRVVDDLSNVITSCAGLRGCPTALDGLQGGYQSYNPGPLHGSVSATEGFGELGIPLAKDLPFVKSLNLDLAGRMTDYSTSGVVYSNKVGLDWQVNDELRFRATHSQDIRAPTLLDLFSTGTTATNQANYPASGTLLPAGSIPVSIPTSALSIGNPNLRPESAQTVTLGTVYVPAWLEGFQGSVDYYSIGIGEALGTIGGQNAIDGCFQGNAFDCSLITIGAGTPITSTTQLVPPASGATPVSGVTVRSVSANIVKQNASGLDLEFAYGMQLWGGTLTGRGLANFALGQSSSNNSVAAAKIVGGDGSGVPYWTSNLSLSYDTESYGVSVQERLISAGYANPNLLQGFTINNNTVPLIGLTNLNLTYKFNAMFNTSNEVFFSVTNLFNQDPPVTVTGSSSFENPTNYGLYDVLGRRFTIGLRVRM